jgi:hypothetical protein
MSLEQTPTRQTNCSSLSTPDASLTVREFCRAERMSRSMLYKAWTEGWGPKFYRVGVSRRITHRARFEWQLQREAAAAAKPRGEA